jgi:DNA polymerase-3 subunit epsilon
LGTLVAYKKFPVEGTFHRALYDSEMTARLWLAMLGDIEQQFEIPAIPFRLMQKLTRTPKHSVHAMLERS